MNLIEHLGGYDKAKEMYIAQLKAGLAPYGYEEALLEYRRANNIFEVGDYVLRNDEFYNVLRITGIDNGCADLVRRVDGEPRWSRFKLVDIHHATPEEIQAGRRL